MNPDDLINSVNAALDEERYAGEIKLTYDTRHLVP